MIQLPQLERNPVPTALAHLEAGRGQWTLLIVDDEEEVHGVTALALDDFSFAGRTLRFLHAHSAREAKDLLAANGDIALVLLDVVMESDTAGLEVVQFVRNDLRNKFVRIILRTGQPGQAPELEVITRYDINGYLHKTELTWERLHTAVYTSLSTYRDLIALEANRHGLEKIIESTAQLFEINSIERFAQGVLEQLIALLFVESDAVMLHTSGVAAAGSPPEEHMRIVAATGNFEELIGRNACQSLPAAVLERIRSAKDSSGLVYGTDHIVGFRTGPQDLVFYVAADTPLSLTDQHLLELFYRNVGIAYSNLCRLAALLAKAQ
jgi:CheY-like chemotaxis protein